MDFSEILQPICSIPSVDNAEVLRNQTYSITEIQADLAIGNTIRLQQMSQALIELGYQTAIINNNVVATKTPGVITNGDTTYKVALNYGLLTLEEILAVDPNKPKYIKLPGATLESDASDSSDYANRYFSIDAKEYREDGSDIAFLRIINAETRNAVFPKFSESPAPGICNNKFKQFIVMQASVPHQERMQIIETNAEYQALFFDKKVEVMSVAGVLKNTVDNPWTINMIFLWDELMRGTKLAENGNICQLYIDGELFEGYPFMFNRSKVAGNDNITNFNFSFLIKNRYVVVNYGQGVADSVNFTF